MEYIIASIILVLIVFIYTINADEHIEGYWIADDTEFTKNAGIDSMMIYIGPRTQAIPWISRECYVVIAPDVANDGFKMSYWQSWNLNKNKYEITATIIFEEDDNQLPNLATWSVDALKGTLTITKDKKVYARLTKQHELEAL